MEYIAASGILLVSLLLAFQLGKDYSRKGKYIIWGITTMFVICPLFSWLVSMGYAHYERSGWATLIMSVVDGLQWRCSPYCTPARSSPAWFYC